MDKEVLVEMIQAITVERDELIRQANQQIAYLNGKIAAIEAVLAAMAGDPPEPVAAD